MTWHVKTSDILRLAKEYLWDGTGRKPPIAKTTAICFAISIATSRLCSCKSDKESREIVKKARRIRNKIQTALSAGRQNHYVVRTWLQLEKEVPAKLLTNKNMQIYRHRWLDKIIADYTAARD